MGKLNVLILQRHAGESIWINKDIQITILGHFNGITHIGIEAPSEIKISTVELEDKKGAL